MQIALNPQGGKAVTIGARVPDADAERVIALAAERGVRPSVVIRELIRLGLEQALALGRSAPPGDGG